MKALVCDLCGGNDIVKTDGYFVCQHCGTKYTVEEARKMMVEGTVDVSGSTIKVDYSDELTNLYEVARRAKDEDNTEKAAKYYDLIVIKDPTSWEASFYSIYYNAINCKIADIASAAMSIANCLENVLSLIYNRLSFEEQYYAVNEIVERCIYIANSLYVATKNWQDELLNRHTYAKREADEYAANLDAVASIYFKCSETIEKYFSNNDDIAKLIVIVLRELKELGISPIATKKYEESLKYDPIAEQEYVNEKRIHAKNVIKNIKNQLAQENAKFFKDKKEIERLTNTLRFWENILNSGKVY